MPQIKLYLQNNRLTELPEAVFDISNLTTLSVYANELRSLSPSVGKLKNLQYLNIDRNPISFYPVAILGLPRLETLLFKLNPSPIQLDINIHSPPSSQQSKSHNSEPILRYTQTTICKYNPSRVVSLMEVCQRKLASTHMFTKEIFDAWDMSRFWPSISRARTCDQ